MTELETLERQLAYSTARSDIECHCYMASKWRERWYDPNIAAGADPCAQMDEEDRETVATALRYLDLRGLLERHSNGSRVRVRDDQ